MFLGLVLGSLRLLASPPLGLIRNRRSGISKGRYASLVHTDIQGHDTSTFVRHDFLCEDTASLTRSPSSRNISSALFHGLATEARLAVGASPQRL